MGSVHPSDWIPCCMLFDVYPWLFYPPAQSISGVLTPTSAARFDALHRAHDLCKTGRLLPRSFHKQWTKLTAIGLALYRWLNEIAAYFQGQ
jgi:hypothetical protein